MIGWGKGLTLDGLDGHEKAILFEVVLERVGGVVLEPISIKQVSSLVALQTKQKDLLDHLGALADNFADVSGDWSALSHSALEPARERIQHV